MSMFPPRREFLAGALATGAAAAAGIAALPQLAAAAPQAGVKRQAYELWIYQMSSGEMVRRADEYFEHALLPALGRAGAGPVGVFVESAKPKAGEAAKPTTSEAPMYVLIPLAGLDAVATVRTALVDDAEYQKAGRSFLSAPPKEPAYANLEARLMLAADFMPVLEAPEKNESRIFELRRYRNPSEAAFRKKLEMFATAELAIFRRVGLNPVFFSEMLFGLDMPNIIYMLAYADNAAHAKAWSEFGKNPDWQKLRVTPGYTDAEIIAGIKSIMLRPTAYSQI